MPERRKSNILPLLIIKFFSYSLDLNDTNKFTILFIRLFFLLRFAGNTCGTVLPSAGRQGSGTWTFVLPTAKICDKQMRCKSNISNFEKLVIKHN